ncbi:MAG: TetR/AcrR family transcriptional regulator [Nitrospirae bacterium YQR-1]
MLTTLKRNNLPKRESHLVRKEQIAEAALSIIGADGIKGLTTATIAKEVGISESSLYRHFKNKEEIIKSVIDLVSQVMMNNYQSAQKEPISSLEKIERFFYNNTAYFEQHRGFVRIMFSSEIVFTKELKQYMSEKIAAYIAVLSGLLDEGKADGSVKADIDSASMAVMFIGMHQLNNLRRLLSGFDYPFKDEALRLWSSFKNIVAVK